VLVTTVAGAPHAYRGARGTEDDHVSTHAETISQGISWNATRAASVLLVVIIATIALIFWPSFDPAEPDPVVPRTTTGVAAPHQPIEIDGQACVQCQP
jgi:hypothetical protein